MKIPNSFKYTSEDYITKLSLQTFCNEHKLKTSEYKAELIKSIEEYSNISSSNEEEVLSWLEDVLKEGVKHLFIRKCEINASLKNKSEEIWEEFINNVMPDIPQTYLATSNHTNRLQCLNYSYEVDDNNNITKVCFAYSIMLHEIKQKDGSQGKIIYPIFIDIDTKLGYIIGRAKSKTNISTYHLGDEDVTVIEDKVNPLGLIINAVTDLFNALRFKVESKDKSTSRFEQVFYKIVSECTETPQDITRIIAQENSNIDEFIGGFFIRNNINELQNENYIKAKEDMKIFIEKYLAVNSVNEEIFKTNRYAYPIKIAATDSDLSSIEESSFGKKPLQSTPIFYDNKKILVREKRCDKISLLYKRNRKKYMSNEDFLLRGEIKSGYCILQNSSYLLEEEIQDVLSRVIRS